MAKLGLALSGGGFRASFFHIGVIASMAELGLLRHVEVISTVSGGSIIGVFYYLHLKQLLESKPDHEITDQDYVTCVERVEKGS
jgi:NTE family protein